MSLASLVGVDGTALGPRFSIVSLLPTSVGALVVLFVVAAGAPGEPSFSQALATARTIDAADVALLAVGALVIAVVLHPLQLGLVRLLEGYWGSGRLIQPVAAALTNRQAAARQRLIDRGVLDADTAVVPEDAAIADQQRRARYPSGSLLPTALGNVLRAGERMAGRRYGLDAIVIWPRLYPVLGDRQRAVVDDRRDQLDLMSRLCATAALVAVVTWALLWRAPVWWLIPLLAFGLSVLAYRAAVSAAVAYGQALDVAFDLYRFDLLRALHLPLPSDNAIECTQNEQLTTWLRQNGPPPASYEHPGSG
jgi:hypothetical protein